MSRSDQVSPGSTPSVVRIFISSPGDVSAEREQARRVVESLQRRYPGVALEPVLWEELALPATASFQQSIDFLLNQQPIDVAVFILWSRLGTPLGAAVLRPDGSPYRSGTEREFDLMLAAFEQSGRRRPVILAYAREDEEGFVQLMRKEPPDRLAELIQQRDLTRSFLREQFSDAEGRNLRAYFVYSEPVGFAQRLSAHLRQALDDLLGGGDSAPRWSADPYRGLECFDVEHAAIFHGRDAETCELLERLRDRGRDGCASVVIVGASGSGKSSLARAGVAATLVQNAFDTGVKDWRIVPFLPALGEGPLLPRLVAALAEKLPELNDAATRLDDVAAGLAESPTLTVRLSIAPAFQKASAAAGGPVRVLILLDQMEELWTGRQIAEGDRAPFLAAVEALARSGHVALLATLRSDFYPHAQQSETFLRLKEGRGHFDLLPPGPAALQRLITEPARLAGATFEQNDATGQSLDQLILQDAARDPAALPLLEYALDELYKRREEKPGGSERPKPGFSERSPAASSARQAEAGLLAASHGTLLTFAAYEQLGGVEGALGQRATETFARLPAEAQAALPEILPLLVTVDVAGEQSAVRRRAPLNELTSTPPRRTLTESLIAARFLTTDREGETATASLSHEALLRKWETLAQWVRQNRNHLRLRARVEQSEQHWNDGGKDSSLLLAAGLPLEEGRQLLTEARSLLRAETAEYVENSVTNHEATSRRARRARNAVIVSLSVLSLLATIGGIVAWMQRLEVRDQRNMVIEKNREVIEKNSSLTQANTRNQELLRRASVADHANARKAWQEDSIARRQDRWVPSVGNSSKWHEALAFWTRSLELDPTNAAAAAWLLDTLERGHSKGNGAICILKHAESVTCATFSPDGNRIVTVSNGAARVWNAASGQEVAIGKEVTRPSIHDAIGSRASFSSNGKWFVTYRGINAAQVWDATTGAAVGEPLRHQDYVDYASFSPDGTRVVTASWDSTARVWDVASGKALGEPMRHRFRVAHAAFDPSGTLIVTVSMDAAQLWDAASSQELFRPMTHSGSGVNGASFSPDGAWIVTASNDHTARVWKAAFRPEGHEPMRHEGPVAHATFSPDGTRIATICREDGSAGGYAQVWDALSGAPVGKPLRHEGPVTHAIFSPDGMRILTVGRDNTARVWDVASATPVGEPLRHESEVDHADFSPDGARIVTASRDKTARVWHVANGGAVGEPLRHKSSVNDASFSIDGTRIVTASRDRTARVWDAASGTPLGEPLQHDFGVFHASFSLHGGRIVTTCGDEHGNTGYARVWDAATGEALGKPLRQKRYVNYAAFSPDQTRIVTAGSDSTAQVWDWANGAMAGRPLQHEAGSWVYHTSFSPDGTRIVTAGDDARVWDAASGTQVGKPLRHNATVIHSVFSPDGSLIVTSGLDGTARIWDAASGAPIGDPLRHEGAVMQAFFSPDGTRILTASQDATARIWDPTSGTEVGNPLRHEDMVLHASFNPDGTRIITASRDGTARVWDAASGDLVGEPLRHPGSVNRASFSPDGTLIVTVSEGESRARVWEAPRTSATIELIPVPRTLIDWSRGVAGLRFRENGELEVIPEDERLRLSETELPAGPWADVAAWWKSHGPQRLMHPRSRFTVRQIAERERDFNIETSLLGARESLESAMEYEPTIPLARMMLAGVLEEVERVAVAEVPGESGPQPDQPNPGVLARAAHFRRYDLDRLPEDAELWERAAKILRVMPDAQVGVGPKPITAAEAADQAERRAAEIRAKGRGAAK